MESHQLTRLETAVHNVTRRLMLMSEKVVSIETELARRRTSAARRRNKRQRRVLGPLTIPEDSFRPDERLPYTHVLRVRQAGHACERVLPVGRGGVGPAVQAACP